MHVLDPNESVLFRATGEVWVFFNTMRLTTNISDDNLLRWRRNILRIETRFLLDPDEWHFQ